MNMKQRLLSALLLLAVSITAFAEGRAKYVFYFIGDGMGVNQVHGTETYLAAIEGRIGVSPLLMTSFPAFGVATTYSATNGVTDSAAGGTALASGQKTKNGAIGVLADLATPVPAISQLAHEAGAAVGVASSVSVDHATPASFYAHSGSRGNYYAIGLDLARSGFDFFAGSDFLQPTSEGGKSLYDVCTEAGYVTARGYKDYRKKARKAERMLLLQSEEASRADRSATAFALDRTPADLSLCDITRAGIHFLTSRQKDGFFLMVEGGKIDWACHSNDAATVFKEIIDLDDAVRVAYEFYEQHPDETLIVITADHETGGIVLGRGPYELHTDLLKHQKMSAANYTKHLSALRAKAGRDFSWELVEQDLKDNWGFWNAVPLNDHQTARLKKAWQAIRDGVDQGVENLYGKDNALADAARRTLAEAALIGWQSGGHSNGYVPVYAIGAGADLFRGKLDNTDIPLRIAKAAGWTAEGK